MIGAGRDEAPIAPLFRAFAEYVHDRATFVGSLQPHGRLDAPMLMALDEVTQICPVPLPSWMADSAGKGILIVAVCHGLAQLEARWDSAGARAIWDTAGIKVILGGVSRPGHPRPAVPAVRRDLPAHPQPELVRRRAAGPHRHLPAGPGAAARTVARPARMARARHPRQPVPGRRPTADGLAAARLPPHSRRGADRSRGGCRARRWTGHRLDWPEAERTDEPVIAAALTTGPGTPRTPGWSRDADPDELTTQPNPAAAAAVPHWEAHSDSVPPPAAAR